MCNEIAADKYKEMCNQIACYSNTSQWLAVLLTECLPSMRKALNSILSATKINRRNSNKPTLVT